MSAKKKDEKKKEKAPEAPKPPVAEKPKSEKEQLKEKIEGALQGYNKITNDDLQAIAKYL